MVSKWKIEYSGSSLQWGLGYIQTPICVNVDYLGFFRIVNMLTASRYLINVFILLK